MKTLLVVIAILFTFGCESNKEDAVRALESFGFTDINIGGTGFWICDKERPFSNVFTAKNAKGMIVHGAVCCGILFEGCTVRF